jgi:hypothetical protein
MKTTLKTMTLTAALFAALSTAPAQAEDSNGAAPLYISYQVMAQRVRNEINADLDRNNAELAKQVQQEAAAAAATAATADASQPKTQEGAFWM